MSVSARAEPSLSSAAISVSEKTHLRPARLRRPCDLLLGKYRQSKPRGFEAALICC